jgi:hypothetical protein
LTGGFGGDEVIETQFSDRSEDGFDVAVGQGAFGHVEVVRTDELVASQDPPKVLDLLPLPVGDIGQGPLPDPVSLPVAYPQEDGGSGVPIGYSFYIHGYSIEHSRFLSSMKTLFTWVHIPGVENA